MKRLLLSLLVISLTVLFPALVRAEKSFLVKEQVEAAIAKNNFSAKDAFGTPLIIKLAREGNTASLLQISKDEITIQDKYNNNLFHVAKDAKTVQTVAHLIRKFYKAKAPALIETMINQRNSQGETPLFAQINAGHTDTFRPLYDYSLLKKKNDIARNQLARQEGSDERIISRNKAIYCKEIRQLASDSAGRTLAQAAQAQVPYHEKMAPLSQALPKIIPCLAQD